MSRLSCLRGLIVGAAMFSGACEWDMTDVELATQLLSVSPPGGPSAVIPGSDIVLTFNQAMMSGMEQYLALHQGG